MRETIIKTEQEQKGRRIMKDNSNGQKINFSIIKNEKGITLVALVITIIIIIILATVAINFAFGNNGLIRRAEDARDYYANDTKYTDESMANVESYLDELIPKVPEEWDTTKVTPVLSEDNKYVPVPKGFSASTIKGEKSVNEGFVIKQGNDGSLTTGINEFVWIPVDGTSLNEMYQEAEGTPLSTYTGVDATTDVYSKLRDSSGNPIEGTNKCEPDILISTTSGDVVSENSSMGIEQIKRVFEFSGTDEQVLDDFADMLVADYEANYASIQKYGGFYIGRYELTGNTANPMVQKDEKILVSQNWYNLYKACNSAVNTDYAQSTMIYGNQWDEVLDWLVDTGMDSNAVYRNSSGWGNYSDYNTANGYEEGDPEYEKTAGTAVQPSGSSEYWKANNIYDLAGNAEEMTQEASGNYHRVTRGGSLYRKGSSSTASSRGGNFPYNPDSSGSSRVVLYKSISNDKSMKLTVNLYNLII